METRYTKCQRCNRPLKSEEGQKRGYGSKCWTLVPHTTAADSHADDNEFSDRPLFSAPPPSIAIEMRRAPDGTVLTNVPHLVTHHSPTGFEFGYGGSGPADLAMNIIQFALLQMGWKGQQTNETWSRDSVFRKTQALYQNFKRDFICNIDQSTGGSIQMSDIQAWIENHPYQEYQETEFDF